MIHCQVFISIDDPEKNFWIRVARVPVAGEQILVKESRFHITQVRWVEENGDYKPVLIATQKHGIPSDDMAPLSTIESA